MAASRERYGDYREATGDEGEEKSSAVSRAFPE
jgi:hypothetical protein